MTPLIPWLTSKRRLKATTSNLNVVKAIEAQEIKILKRPVTILLCAYTKLLSDPYERSIMLFLGLMVIS